MELTNPTERLAAIHLHSFVPANVPRKRRLQTLAVAFWSAIIIWSAFAFLFLLYVSFPAPVPLMTSASMVCILILARLNVSQFHSPVVASACDLLDIHVLRSKSGTWGKAESVVSEARILEVLR